MYSISVIIPTLNEENFIANCLDCIINQTYPFSEMDIMVIDGGSKDKTRDIVIEYHNKYSNIRLLSNPGKIQSIAFNIGVEKSKAQYVIRLDAHALYDKAYIELCVDGLKADSKRGNVGGRWNILPFNKSLWARTNAILNCSHFGIGGSAFRVSTVASDVDSVPFGAFPRCVIEEIGGMREDLPRGEDNEYNSRIRKAGYKVFFDPRIVCSYYSRPTLVASCKQMYANGESIGHLFYVDRDSIGLRHLVPLLFVSFIFFCMVFSIIWSGFWGVLFAGLLLYFICDVVASFLSSKEHGMIFFLPLMVLFFSVHVSYGVGTIIGFYTGRRLKSTM